MSLAGIKLRSQVVETTRRLLLSQGFNEYCPQLMRECQPLEQAIYPFKTQWDRQQQGKTSATPLYFATSPEGYLKQITAAGENRVFAISHAFRNLEGEGSLHQPEFLMAEWYAKDTDWLQMISQTQTLVSQIWAACSPKTQPKAGKPWETISYRDVWRQHTSTDLETLLDDKVMINFAVNRGYQVNGATWEQLFNQVVFNEIEPHFGSNPFFLIDFPSRISPLAKPQPTAQGFAERFELIINRIEIANGNTENTNAAQVEAMMEQERKIRQQTDRAVALDTTFIDSLSKLQNHSWAGVGLGLDRLSMMIGEIDSVHDVQWP